jgi:hypothetical protein
MQQDVPFLFVICIYVVMFLMIPEANPESICSMLEW